MKLKVIIIIWVIFIAFTSILCATSFALYNKDFNTNTMAVIEYNERMAEHNKIPLRLSDSLRSYWNQNFDMDIRKPLKIQPIELICKSGPIVYSDTICFHNCDRKFNKPIDCDSVLIACYEDCFDVRFDTCVSLEVVDPDTLWSPGFASEADKIYNREAWVRKELSNMGLKVEQMKEFPKEECFWNIIKYGPKKLGLSYEDTITLIWLWFVLVVAVFFLTLCLFVYSEELK